MNNCHVEQHVSGVRVKWQDGKRKSAWRLDISHQGKVKKKVRSCHVTTKMPLKSSAVSEYTQVSANTPVCFSFNEYLRYCNTRERPGCIGDDRLSGSHFQIYFHDKHLFQIHHVLSLLSELHVIPGKTISVAAGIDTNRVSWWWTLIILSSNNDRVSAPFLPKVRNTDLHVICPHQTVQEQAKTSEYGLIRALIKHRPSLTQNNFSLPCITCVLLESTATDHISHSDAGGEIKAHLGWSSIVWASKGPHFFILMPSLSSAHHISRIRINQIDHCVICIALILELYHYAFKTQKPLEKKPNVQC